MYADDTIAAIATPPGAGGIGVVRVSGPDAARIASRVFVRPAPGPWRPRHLYYGRIVDAAAAPIDRALAALMPAPHSYTGESVLELHCHGSPLLLRRVLARVLECGARPAQPGEFTRRAFLNGRLDLAQAEAVADLVRARTEAAAGLAAAQLDGALSAALTLARDRLVGLKALLEAQIDFSEEDFSIGCPELLAAADACAQPIATLLGSYRRGKLLRDGLRLAIVGKPNVGKSSLLNALLGEERVIVTAIAGTTRDAIDESADFDGVPVVLSDTAGLRPPAAADAVERIGMDHTLARVNAADALLVVLDRSQPLDAGDQQVLAATANTPRLIVLNKSDLPAALRDTELHGLADAPPLVAVSARERLGLEALRHAVIARATGACATGAAAAAEAVVSNVRHADALAKAADSLHRARASIAAGRPADLVAVDVQDAIDHIAAITGAITSEDVLDRIFSEFCIGK